MPRQLSMIGAALACSLVASCGGGEQRTAETTGAGGANATSGSSASAVAPGANTSGAPQAPTGKIWDVKMFGDASGYRFDPATLTIRVGDAVRWTVVSGPPHNVTFWSDSIPPAASIQLSANMPETTAPLSGPLRNNVNDTYVVSFAGVARGTYSYYCTPHLALGMKGRLTVQ